MRDQETNTGWWTERPDRENRPSSYASLGHGDTRRRRGDGVWVRAALVVALMVALGWAVLRLANH